jgi:urease accessory protein
MSNGSSLGVPAEPAGLVLPLMAWLSPTFPVGGYAYSHGLEWAVEAGDIVDEATLVEWLMAVLQHGAGRNDAILLATAYRASQAGQDRDLSEANDLALALAPSQELRLETRQQGRSFLDAALAAWPSLELARRAGHLEGEVAYPIAVGLAAGAYGTDLRATIEAFLFSFLQNLVSAAVRLAPIGQTSGARVLATLAPSISALALDVPARGLDEIGSATLRADLGSFLHETQYTRLFRS